MTGTFRRALRWVRDDKHYGNCRKSMARDKPIERRIQRRKHARIVRESLQEYETEIKLLIQEMQEFDDYHSAIEFEIDEWYASWEEDPLDDSYQDDWDYTYDHYDDYSWNIYGDDYYPRHSSIEEDPHDRIIKPEDTGKSLGDLLAELLERKENQHGPL